MNENGSSSTSRHQPEQVNVVGVDVSPIDMASLVEQIVGWSGPPRVAVGVNAHVCNLSARSSRFAELLRSADLRYADGKSIVWAIRLLGHQCKERVATTDLIFPLAQRCAAENKRLYLYGGEPGVAAAAARRLRELAPGLEIATTHGYGTPAEVEQTIAEINNFCPQVLLVGLGDPRQQEWIAQYRRLLQVPAILSCGGLFDWTSQRHPRPPDLMVRIGLEWLWRLRLEPRRLAGRYLIGNPQFAVRLIKQLVQIRLARARKGPEAP